MNTLSAAPGSVTDQWSAVVVSTHTSLQHIPARVNRPMLRGMSPGEQAGPSAEQRSEWETTGQYTRSRSASDCQPRVRKRLPATWQFGARTTRSCGPRVARIRLRTAHLSVQHAAVERCHVHNLKPLFSTILKILFLRQEKKNATHSGRRDSC